MGLAEPEHLYIITVPDMSDAFLTVTTASDPGAAPVVETYWLDNRFVDRHLYGSGIAASNFGNHES